MWLPQTVVRAPVQGESLSRPTPYVPALGFDRLTALYDPLVRLTTRETETKRRLLDQAALAPGERILDLGCGTGTLSIQAKRREPETDISGLDGDPSVLERARRKAEAGGVAIRFDEALADRMPYPDGAFHKVLSSLFFHHLDREVKERTVREIARVLRPGGQRHVADWGPPRGLLGPALFLTVRLLDGFDTTADNARGRLPEVFAAGGLTRVRGRGRLQTPLGTLAFFSGERPGST